MTGDDFSIILKNMKVIFEKISLLSLSLMLVSTFAIAPLVPEMLRYYSKEGLSTVQVESLVSLPSFAIIGILLLNSFIKRWLSERQMVIMGLFCLSFGGMFPFFNQDYLLVAVSRIVLGLGIGLINAQAINLISHYYSGRERVVMLGLRGSTEVLGSALLTTLAGLSLRFSWTFGFLVYGLGLPIVLLYVWAMRTLKIEN